MDHDAVMLARPWVVHRAQSFAFRERPQVRCLLAPGKAAHLHYLLAPVGLCCTALPCVALACASLNCVRLICAECLQTCTRLLLYYKAHMLTLFLLHTRTHTHARVYKHNINTLL